MLVDKLWKEQLAFVSGNILLLGVFLLKLWPIVSRFQTNMHIRLFRLGTLDIPQQIGLRSEYYVYWLMTAVLALTASAVILASVHIFSRGVWLAISAGHQDSATSDLEESLDHICQLTYDAIFVLAVLIGLVLIATVVDLAIIGFVQFLVSFFKISISAASWISWILMILVTGVFACIFSLKLLIPKLIKSSPMPFSLSVMMLSVMWLITVGTCYTLDLTVNEKIFDRTQNDIIEIYVTLGGATSDVDVANLRLLDSNGTSIDNLTMHYMGQGQYLTYIISSTLPSGCYQVMLEYPQASWSSSYPFRQSVTRKSQRLLVIP